MTDQGPRDITELADGLYRIPVPGGDAHLLNAYVWTGEGEVTLIDTGWAESAPVIEAALGQLGVERADVRQIVLTHFHDDHAGAAAEIRSWGGATVIAGAPDAPFVRGDRTGPLPRLTAAELTIHPADDAPPQAAPCRVDRTVEDGDTLDFAGGVTVLAVPGHTPGSIALRFPALDVVLTGDAVAEFDGDVILGVFDTDRAAAAQSQAKIARTRAQIAGFGHGNPVLSGAADRIADATDPFADA